MSEQSSESYAYEINRQLGQSGYSEMGSEFIEQCEKNGLSVDQVVQLGQKNQAIRGDLQSLGFGEYYTGGGCHHFEKELGYMRGHTWVITLANESLSWNLVVGDPTLTFSLSVCEGRCESAEINMQAEPVYVVEVQTRSEMFGKTMIERMCERAVQSIHDLEIPDGVTVVNDFPATASQFALDNTPILPSP